jgi:hypothetical protein
VKLAPVSVGATNVDVASKSVPVAPELVLMRAKHAELAEAQATGDEKLVAELEAFGPALQQRIHRQGFGTAPVDDILALIEDQLPVIAEASGVDVLVSKWALAYHRPDASFVDVTDRLAAEFDPDEKTLKTIREVLASEPVPMDQLREDH